MSKTVALITMGCARNDVDSEELAGRLAADGWKLVDDAADAEVAVINTCGFIESAKQDSINSLLEAHALKGNGVTKAVVAVGCMAERYGEELATALPEADGILSFDDYKDISARLGEILSGQKPAPHTPQDRRNLLPISPAERKKETIDLNFARKRLNDAPWAPLKIASGCDRRCAFCAIPQFRGAFISRHPLEVIEEAKWLADNGVSEVFLVSENTTSYGKDLGDLRAMEKLIPELSKIDGIKRIRLSYLQPAEMRPTLLQAMIEDEKVAPYFDLSFQHSAKDVLRSMRRFGGNEEFLHLISQIRALSPDAGIRSNFIVGFPGETEDEFEHLLQFVREAQIDRAGCFAYSPVEGALANQLDHPVPDAIREDRRARFMAKAEEISIQRLARKVGKRIQVLIDRVDESGGIGRTVGDAPEIDGLVRVLPPSKPSKRYRTGEIIRATVISSQGHDLIAET